MSLSEKEQVKRVHGDIRDKNWWAAMPGMPREIDGGLSSASRGLSTFSLGTGSVFVRSYVLMYVRALCEWGAVW